MIYHLCLGANMNEPEQQISTAISAIEAEQEISVLRKSSLIKSAPYGKTDQADFYNQVIEIDSSLIPQLLLEKLLAIETKLGRIRMEKWGERIIDIDILLAEDLIYQSDGKSKDDDLHELTIPHPDFHNREFALRLLTELIPDYIHPIQHKSISELYDLLINSGGTQ